MADLLDLLERDYRANRRDWASVSYKVALLRRRLGHIRATNLTEVQVDRFRDSLIEERKSNATTNRHLAALRRAYRIAFRKRLIPHMPSFELLTETGSERSGYASLADLEAILAKFRESEEGIRDLARFAYFSGRRRGQLCELMWADIEFDSRRAPVCIRFPAKNVKNRRSDSIPLTSELAGIIARRVERRAVERPNGEVFLAPHVFHIDDGRPIKRDRVSRVWRRCADASGFPNLRFHDTRACFGTNAMRSGKVDDKTFARLGGWRTDYAAKKYRRINEQDLVEGFEAVEEFAKSQGERRVVPIEEKRAGDGA